MKKLAVLCMVAMGAALVVLGTAPAASAYPERTCSVSVDHQVVDPGDRFTATGTASGVDSKNRAVPSSSFRWSFEWNGVTQDRTGAEASVSYKAPKVSHARTITLTARSTSPDGDCVRHIDITVRSTSVSAPGGGAGSGAGSGAGHHGSAGGFTMPNTGGPAFWILLAALVALVGGGGAVVVSRRRDNG